MFPMFKSITAFYSGKFWMSQIQISFFVYARIREESVTMSIIYLSEYFLKE